MRDATLIKELRRQLAGADSQVRAMKAQLKKELAINAVATAKAMELVKATADLYHVFHDKGDVCYQDSLDGALEALFALVPGLSVPTGGPDVTVESPAEAGDAPGLHPGVPEG